MTEANFKELQPELDLGEEREALALRMAEIDKQIAARVAAARASVLSDILASIKAHGFTAAELGLATEPKVKAGKKSAGVKVESKYKDPDSAATWTGRGKTPGWMVAQVAAGHTYDDFLIKSTCESNLQPAINPN